MTTGILPRPGAEKFFGMKFLPARCAGTGFDVRECLTCAPLPCSRTTQRCTQSLQHLAAALILHKAGNIEVGAFPVSAKVHLALNVDGAGWVGWNGDRSEQRAHHMVVLQRTAPVLARRHAALQIVLGQ